MDTHFILRQTLRQYTSRGESVHDTLQSLPRSYEEPGWMRDMRALLLPWKVWKRKTSAESIAKLLAREGFEVCEGARTATEQCLHVALEESSDWSLAEVQISDGLIRNVFLHRG